MTQASVRRWFARSIVDALVDGVAEQLPVRGRQYRDGPQDGARGDGSDWGWGCWTELGGEDRFGWWTRECWGPGGLPSPLDRFVGLPLASYYLRLVGERALLFGAVATATAAT